MVCLPFLPLDEAGKRNEKLAFEELLDQFDQLTKHSSFQHQSHTNDKRPVTVINHATNY